MAVAKPSYYSVPPQCPVCGPLYHTRLLTPNSQLRGHKSGKPILALGNRLFLKLQCRAGRYERLFGRYYYMQLPEQHRVA